MVAWLCNCYAFDVVDDDDCHDAARSVFAFPACHGWSKNATTSLLWFGLGYGLAWLAWLAFSVFATAPQFITEALGLLHGMRMWSVSGEFTITLLAAAGLYQFSRQKRVGLMRCVDACGDLGTFTTGLRYGRNCLQASWALMLLLFVGGIMNLYWVIGLTLIIAVEKALPDSTRFSQAVGSVLLLIAALNAIAAF